MSDGPHRSLPMSRGWQRVAERGANVAFTVAEISAAIIPALEHDCKVDAGLIEEVCAIIEAQDGTLFKSDIRPQLEILRQNAGSGIGRLWIDNVVQLSTEGAAEFADLARAMTDALIERAAKGARSVEEHYCRKSSAPGRKMSAPGSSNRLSGLR